MNRRNFIINSTITLLGAIAGYSYFFGKCSLDTQGNGVCPSACAAFLDLNDDGVCDRLPDSAIPATQALVAANDHSTVKPTCPLELVNDPYPGDCNLYIDADGNGICDLSEPELVASGAVAPPPRTPEPTPPGITLAPRPQTVCPLGLVNDPYPGECKWYVDANGNGICDLSEPELVASGAVTPPVNGTTASSSSTQQRRRGRNN